MPADDRENEVPAGEFERKDSPDDASLSVRPAANNRFAGKKSVFVSPKNDRLRAFRQNADEPSSEINERRLRSGRIVRTERPAEASSEPDYEDTGVSCRDGTSDRRENEGVPRDDDSSRNDDKNRNGGRARDAGRGRDRNGRERNDHERTDRERNDRGRNHSGNGEKSRSGPGGRPRRDKKSSPAAVTYEGTSEFVIPGCVIGTAEEYTPGFGTAADRGNIIATISGNVGINQNYRMISVIPATAVPNVIRDGDIVIASVTDIRESSARVEIAATEKAPDREIVNNGNAEIYISNVKDGFTRAISEEFAVRDIVRARVINASKIGLSTVGDDLGVIKAYCGRCKTALDKNGASLKCPMCGNTETRKTADGYGRGVSF